MFKNLTRGDSETQGPNVPNLDQAETQEPLQIEKLVSSGQDGKITEFLALMEICQHQNRNRNERRMASSHEI